MSAKQPPKRINQEKLNRRLLDAAKEREERQASWATPKTKAAPPAPLPRYAPLYRETFDSLGELMATGCLTRLLVRDDGHNGVFWTLKAVFPVSENPAYVYMCGKVAAAEMLPSVIDGCLRKGQWHEDKYPAKQ